MTPCLKREVCAVIVSNKGEIVVGQNLINNKNIKKCPRKNNEGYKKCISICNQINGHAEIDAINKAKIRNFDLTMSKLFLFGHNKVCDDCLDRCNKENLDIIIMGDLKCGI